MKFKGEAIQPPTPVEVKIRRGENDLVITLKAVMNFDEFDELVPEPKPPLVTDVKTNTKTKDIHDAGYVKKMDDYFDRRTDWTMIKSLEDSGLEFEKVDPGKPETWKDVQKELRECFTPAEANTILNGIAEAQHPTQKTQREALDLFAESPNPE